MEALIILVNIVMQKWDARYIWADVNGQVNVSIAQASFCVSCKEKQTDIFCAFMWAISVNANASFMSTSTQAQYRLRYRYIPNKYYNIIIRK